MYVMTVHIRINRNPTKVMTLGASHVGKFCGHEGGRMSAVGTPRIATSLTRTMADQNGFIT